MWAAGASSQVVISGRRKGGSISTFRFTGHSPLCGPRRSPGLLGCLSPVSVVRPFFRAPKTTLERDTQESALLTVRVRCRERTQVPASAGESCSGQSPQAPVVGLRARPLMLPAIT